MNKIYPDAKVALDGLLSDGMLIAAGGFGLCGIPELLIDAIADLPENQRIVFLMNRLDKKTYKEIAELLDISVKAVEKRMHKALKELRKVHKRV